MRPRPELARYKTPVDGLWLCGPATHPGGGVPGASGFNCARAILDEKGER
jgi:phytoene dehydrogenase-like protein